MQKAFIDKISYFLPEKKLTNHDFFEMFPTSASNKSLKQIGIEERRIVEDGVLASDLAVSAAEKLFDEHGIDRNEIDFILFCAQEFDYYTPTTACVIQTRLNLPESCGALDFNLGCSGFVYGLSIAKGLVESGSAKKVLLLTASTLTKKIHPKDKSSRYLFGDGAAATIISTRENEGIGAFQFGTDGSGKKKIIVEDGGDRNPLTESSHNEREDEYGNITSRSSFYMNGTGIFLFGLRKVPALVTKTLEVNNLTIDEIDLVVFHQANAFLLHTLRKKMDIPEEKMYLSLSKTGNTVSSTIPIALHNAIKDGKAKNGDIILLTAFGVGLSWAATVVRL